MEDEEYIQELKKDIEEILLPRIRKEAIIKYGSDAYLLVIAQEGSDIRILSVSRPHSLIHDLKESGGLDVLAKMGPEVKLHVSPVGSTYNIYF